MKETHTMHPRHGMFTTDRHALGHGDFSLIELMTAMAVLAILSALAISIE
jgi:prepilin-type N-terminal cleavage/methylation domain-containing protein